MDLVTIREGAEAKACPFVITEIESFHDEEGGALRGTNVIRIFDDGEYRIAHMGDIGCMPTEEQKDMLRGVDVMLIPVGGFFTMEPDRIKALVDELKPVVTVPMHYRTEAFGFGILATPDAFVRDFAGPVTELDGSALSLTDAGPSGLILLRPAMLG